MGSTEHALDKVEARVQYTSGMFGSLPQLPHFA
jgi:hypothetical protein